MASRENEGVIVKASGEGERSAAGTLSAHRSNAN